VVHNHHGTYSILRSPHIRCAFLRMNLEKTSRKILALTNKRLFTVCLLSTLLVAGCGGGGGGSTNSGVVPIPPANSQLITGQALKGPMSDAIVEILSPDGSVLAAGQALNGHFELSADISAHAYIEIRTRGGYFMDEATGSRIDVSSDEGLHAYVAAADFATRARQIVLTPETTIVAGMVRRSMQAGNGLQTSMVSGPISPH
jgi:hypothetical protein